MSTSAASIVQRATIVLQDPTSIRWPVNELVLWLNSGQKEIVVHRPDAGVIDATKALSAGSRQTLPSGGVKLLDVHRNTAGPAVRLTQREILDAQIPGWHLMTGVANIQHFMFDVRDPTVFYVYPPALNTASVELTYSGAPADVTVPSPGQVYSDVTGNINVPDIYANVLLDYILYRAYAKDVEYAANPGLASAYYTAFANALGIELKATVDFQPKAPGNPNLK